MTQRSEVRLRAMEPEDLDFLYGIENSRDTWLVGNTSVPYSRYVLHDYIANATDDIYADGQVRLIMENAERRIVGMVDVFDFNPANRRAEVSIVVHGDYRRRGYAIDALKQIVDYALRILHLHQLYAIIAEDNLPSLGLFEKGGFKRCCKLYDWLYDGTEYRNAVLMNKIF